MIHAPRRSRAFPLAGLLLSACGSGTASNTQPPNTQQSNTQPPNTQQSTVQSALTRPAPSSAERTAPASASAQHLAKRQPPAWEAALPLSLKGQPQRHFPTRILLREGTLAKLSLEPSASAAPPRPAERTETPERAPLQAPLSHEAIVVRPGDWPQIVVEESSYRLLLFVDASRAVPVITQRMCLCLTFACPAGQPPEPPREGASGALPSRISNPSLSQVPGPAEGVCLYPGAKVEVLSSAKLADAERAESAESTAAAKPAPVTSASVTSAQPAPGSEVLRVRFEHAQLRAEG